MRGITYSKRGYYIQENECEINSVLPLEHSFAVPISIGQDTTSLDHVAKKLYFARSLESLEPDH